VLTIQCCQNTNTLKQSERDSVCHAVDNFMHSNSCCCVHCIYQVTSLVFLIYYAVVVQHF